MYKNNLICWNCRNINEPNAKRCSSCGITLKGPTSFESHNNEKTQQTDNVMHNNCNEIKKALEPVISCPYCGSRNLSRIMKQPEPPTKAPIFPKMWHFPTPQPEYKTMRRTRARTEMGCLYWLFVGWWIWGFYLCYWMIKGMCWLFYAMIRLIFQQALSIFQSKGIINEEYEETSFPVFVCNDCGNVMPDDQHIQ